MRHRFLQFFPKSQVLRRVHLILLSFQPMYYHKIHHQNFRIYNQNLIISWLLYLQRDDISNQLLNFLIHLQVLILFILNQFYFFLQFHLIHNSFSLLLLNHLILPIKIYKWTISLHISIFFQSRIQLNWVIATIYLVLMDILILINIYRPHFHPKCPNLFHLLLLLISK